MKLIDLLQSIRASGRPFYTRRQDGSIHLSIDLGVDAPALYDALKNDHTLARALLLSAYTTAGAQVVQDDDIVVPAAMPGPRKIRLTLGERGMDYSNNMKSVIAGKTNDLLVPPSMFVVFEMMLEARRRGIELRGHSVTHAIQHYKGDPLVVSRSGTPQAISASVIAIIDRYHRFMKPFLTLPLGRKVKGRVHVIKSEIEFEVFGSILSAAEIESAFKSKPVKSSRPTKGREATPAEPGTQL
jgi:hypothetical protein